MMGQKNKKNGSHDPDHAHIVNNLSFQS